MDEQHPKPSLLLHPPIPPPIHGLVPRKLLGEDWWNRERKRAYRKHKFHCHACGICSLKAKFYPRLEGHEIYDIDYKRLLSTYIKTVALCHACHNYIHKGRLHSLLFQRKCTKRKYNIVIHHGEYILRKNGLIIPKEENVDLTLWSKWRLKIGRKKYKPFFKTKKDWIAYYQRS